MAVYNIEGKSINSSVEDSFSRLWKYQIHFEFDWKQAQKP